MTGHQTEQAAHSPIGASSCERWWNCPGSVELSKQVPVADDTIYSATGTVAHGIAERALNLIRAHKNTPRGQHLETLGPIVESFLDNLIGDVEVEGDFEIEVTENMTEAIKVYIDEILRLLDEYGLPVDNLREEVRFQIPHIDPEAFGTCDAVLVSPMNKIIIVDYKHGQGYAVEVEDNHQLQYYALGAYYDLDPADRRDLACVEMVIVQPRAKHIDGTVRRHRKRIADLLLFEKELTEAVKRVREGNPALQTGSWCKFCRGKAICPAIRGEIQQKAGIAFSKVDTEPLVLEPPAALSVDKLSQLMDNAEMLKSWCNAVIGMATKLAERGMKIPKYKLVTKFGHRKWGNPAVIEEIYGLEFGKEIYNEKLKSPAQLEKLLGKKRKPELEQYIETPVSGRTLAPETDTREETKNRVTETFSNPW